MYVYLALGENYLLFTLRHETCFCVKIHKKMGLGTFLLDTVGDLWADKVYSSHMKSVIAQQKWFKNGLILVQWVKVLATELDDRSLIPMPRMIKD